MKPSHSSNQDDREREPERTALLLSTGAAITAIVLGAVNLACVILPVARWFGSLPYEIFIAFGLLWLVLAAGCGILLRELTDWPREDSTAVSLFVGTAFAGIAGVIVNYLLFGNAIAKI